MVVFVVDIICFSPTQPRGDLGLKDLAHFVTHFVTHLEGRNMRSVLLLNEVYSGHAAEVCNFLVSPQERVEVYRR